MGQITYTAHARAMLIERQIHEEWIERTVADPQFLEADPGSPNVQRAFRPIPENGGRILRVVYAEENDGARVLTAFFDRSRKK